MREKKERKKIKENSKYEYTYSYFINMLKFMTYLDISGD